MTSGDLTRLREISRDQWRSHMTSGDLTRLREISCVQWRSHETRGDLTWPVEISRVQWRSHVTSGDLTRLREISRDSGRSHVTSGDLTRLRLTAIGKSTRLWQFEVNLDKWTRPASAVAAIWYWVQKAVRLIVLVSDYQGFTCSSCLHLTIICKTEPFPGLRL